MNRLDQIKQVILLFETTRPVSDWRYEQMDIWPVLRSLVYVECRNQINSQRFGVNLDWNRKIKGRRISRYLSKLKKLLFFLVSSPIPNFPEDQHSRFSSQNQCKPVDVMFFGSWYFRTVYKNRLINKFFQPMKEKIAEDFGLQSIEVEYAVDKKYKSEYEQLKGEIEFVSNYSPRIKDKNRIDHLRSHPLFKELFNSLTELGFERKLSVEIAEKIENVYIDSYRYECLFQIYRPKIAFCLTFFNEAMFSMIFAASRHGVKTVDVGHGFPSDPENLIYNKLCNVPKQGYNTLPDYFWVWDEPVSRAMNQWIRLQNKHQVIIGGNPWLTYLSNGLIKQTLSAKPVILYTLTVNLPEKFIIEAMAKSADHYEWWIRIHPSVLKSAQQVSDTFLKNGLKNFNLAEANSMDLPLLLKNATVHISRNSSSIYESIQMGNTPILIDEESKIAYAYYLEKGTALSLKKINSNSLLESITRALQIPKRKSVSSEPMQEALNFLLENHYSSQP